MFFASLGGDAYGPLLREAGLEPVRDEVVIQREPGHGDVSFRWALARASAQRNETSPWPGSRWMTTSSRTGSRPASRSRGPYASPPSDAKNMGAPSQSASIP